MDGTRVSGTGSPGEVFLAFLKLGLTSFGGPVWTSAALRPIDFALAVAGFVALVVWKASLWLVVVALAAIGGVIGTAA